MFSSAKRRRVDRSFTERFRDTFEVVTSRGACLSFLQQRPEIDIRVSANQEGPSTAASDASQLKCPSGSSSVLEIPSAAEGIKSPSDYKGDGDRSPSHANNEANRSTGNVERPLKLEDELTRRTSAKSIFQSGDTSRSRECKLLAEQQDDPLHTGCTVWEAAELLVDFLVHGDFFTEYYYPHILELGAGTGAVGLTAAAVVPCEKVLLSDLPSIQPLLARNVARNSFLRTEYGVRAIAGVLCWGKDGLLLDKTDKKDCSMTSPVQLSTTSICSSSTRGDSSGSCESDTSATRTSSPDCAAMEDVHDKIDFSSASCSGQRSEPIETAAHMGACVDFHSPASTVESPSGASAVFLTAEEAEVANAVKARPDLCLCADLVYSMHHVDLLLATLEDLFRRNNDLYVVWAQNPNHDPLAWGMCKRQLRERYEVTNLWPAFEQGLGIASSRQSSIGKRGCFEKYFDRDVSTSDGISCGAAGHDETSTSSLDLLGIRISPADVDRVVCA
ncbi:unnamed protein product [Amoebophrya sp. A25]|nr:unnamed protein product [Amoebophrya sp. A25]|eukprot:GSA25T00021719001.1